MAPNTETRIVRKRVQPDTKDVGFIESEGSELLRVPISSTNEDRDGDTFSKDGLENLQAQLETGTVKMFPDHGLDENGQPVYRFSDIMGKWVGGEIEGDTLFGFAKLREGNEHAEELRDLVEQEMPVGFSVGFGVPEGAAKETSNGQEFEAADLMETSPVGIESNPDAIVGAALAKAFDNAGVEPTESLVADLTDAIKSMTEEEKADEEEEEEQTESKEEETKEEEEEEEEEKTVKELGEEEAQLAAEAAERVFSEHMSAAVADFREMLMDGMETDAEDGEEEEEDKESDEEEEEMSADVKALVDTVEDLKETNEELEAKVESLESKSRDSAGKKGMVPTEEKEEQTEETEAKEAPEDFYANLA